MRAILSLPARTGPISFRPDSVLFRSSPVDDAAVVGISIVRSYHDNSSISAACCSIASAIAFSPEFWCYEKTVRVDDKIGCLFFDGSRNVQFNFLICSFKMKNALKTIPRISKDEWDSSSLVTRWLIAVRSRVLALTLFACCIAGIISFRAYQLCNHLLPAQWF